MGYACTGVILAGGLNTRLSGRTKALLKVGGTRILDRIMDLFTALFDEVILVTNDPLQYLEWDVHITADLYSIRSALTGIHTGLFYATQPHAFFMASDIPFMKKQIVEAILSGMDPAVDIVVPETKAGLEPLCAVYSKRRLPVIEKNLNRRNLKIQHIFNGAQVKKITEARLRKIDPDLVSFFNINTPEQLARAEEMVLREGRWYGCRTRDGSD